MEKKIYLVRGSAGEGYQNFSQRILEAVKKAAEHPDVLTVKVRLTDRKPPRVTIIPFKKSNMACISVNIPKGMTISVLDQLSGMAA